MTISRPRERMRCCLGPDSRPTLRHPGGVPAGKRAAHPAACGEASVRNDQQRRGTLTRSGSGLGAWAKDDTERSATGAGPRSASRVWRESPSGRTDLRRYRQGESDLTDEMRAVEVTRGARRWATASRWNEADPERGRVGWGLAGEGAIHQRRRIRRDNRRKNISPALNVKQAGWRGPGIPGRFTQHNRRAQGCQVGSTPFNSIHEPPIVTGADLRWRSPRDRNTEGRGRRPSVHPARPDPPLQTEPPGRRRRGMAGRLSHDHLKGPQRPDVAGLTDRTHMI